MKNFIVYNLQGKILRTGCCQTIDLKAQANMDADEFVMLGEGDATLQRVVAGKLVDKPTAQLEAEKAIKPPPIPEADQPAAVTNAQWQNVLNRLKKLET